MTRLSILDTVVLALLAIGGLNWGLVGIFQFDLVAALLGDATILARTVYTLVGISAIYTVAFFLPRLVQMERIIESEGHKITPRLRKVA